MMRKLHRWPYVLAVAIVALWAVQVFTGWPLAADHDREYPDICYESEPPRVVLLGKCASLVLTSTARDAKFTVHQGNGKRPRRSTEMTKRLTNCNCGRTATTKIQISVRIMGEYRDEWRDMTYCQRCAAEFVASGMGRNSQ